MGQVHYLMIYSRCKDHVIKAIIWECSVLYAPGNTEISCPQPDYDEAEA